jgi:hypoxia-inducible factor 1 alpha
VIQRDNIVLGISDLKQHKQRKISNCGTNINNNSNNNNKTDIIAATNKCANVESIDINNKKERQSSVVINNPIDTIKVNNCEIINRRPRSVTAAIFAQPTIILPQKNQQKLNAKEGNCNNNTSNHNNINQEATTVKIYRPSNQNATSVTSTIFAPRTKDMNKGYLMFSEEDTGLTSKYHFVSFQPRSSIECLPKISRLFSFFYREIN